MANEIDEENNDDELTSYDLMTLVHLLDQLPGLQQWMDSSVDYIGSRTYELRAKLVKEAKAREFNESWR